ncbi:FUSC family protein [Gallaecimonas pentaromativorans]|uniref:Putative membrane protein YccC n=1 Tax=Gallaecimonas pentaromativorans TaxID=584787 RepID=A0A3N1PUQ3_9GAMM|nr:FUSC family protein [Gallaecimonas pentaromativorans]ROQ30851.1 putative membrane protein YccC [Gallaecimonas pentaromativorans]
MATDAWRLPSSDDWRQAARAWARSDGLVWVYLFKVVLAAFLTVSLAMVLQLQKPSTAMITVFIVMQPQSGQVIAKGLFRLLGSVVGLAVMVLLLGLFAQQRWLFLGAMALWIGFCIAGAARYRDWRFYGFVLAGYTAALIGLPASLHPQTAILDAIWRVLEIALAIFCSTLVSVLVFPQTSHGAMNLSVASRFGRFAAFVLEHLDGQDPQVLRKVNVEFATQAVGLEAMRTVSAIEDPHTRLRSQRLIQLNNDFLGLLTHFNALHRQLRRLQENGQQQVLAALEPCLAAFKAELAPWPDSMMSPQEAARLAEAIGQFQGRLMPLIRDCRQPLKQDDAALLEFNTAAELLYHFTEALVTYAHSHHALAARLHVREQWKGDFASQANLLASLVSGVRAAAAIFVGGAIWFALDWQAGPYMLVNAAAICALSSGMPNPSKLAVQMAMGTFVGGVFGVIESVYVYPLIDGLPLLLMALLPVVMLGTYITMKPAWAGFGLGLLIMFSMGSVPTNPTVYAPLSVISAYGGLFMGAVLAAVANSVLLPPASGWMWRAWERDLRATLAMVADDDLGSLPGRFDSRSRDILSQVYGLAARRPDVQTELVQWSLIVQEVGHAMLNWRQEVAAMAPTPWHQELNALQQQLVALFMAPSADELLVARQMLDVLLAKLQGQLGAQDHFDRSPLRRVVSYLHFARTTLLDRHSILYRRCHKGADHAQ